MGLRGIVWVHAPSAYDEVLFNADYEMPSKCHPLSHKNTLKTFLDPDNELISTKIQLSVHRKFIPSPKKFIKIIYNFELYCSMNECPMNKYIKTSNKQTLPVVEVMIIKIAGVSFFFLMFF